MSTAIRSNLCQSKSQSLLREIRIVAVWVYQSFDHYKEVQGLVAEDADSIAAQEYRRQELDPLFTETDESFYDFNGTNVIDGTLSLGNMNVSQDTTRKW